MRNYINHLLVLMVTFLLACNNTPAKPPAETKASPEKTPAYNLPVPQGWQTEKINFPIEFAPQIPYKGVEELRFAPGFEMKKTEDYWTYSFLWWLEDNPVINENVLQENLGAYYTGLVGSNVKQRAIPPTKMVPVVSTIKKIETAKGDSETYSGAVTITDYMDLQFNPLTLNCIIHKKNCGTHTAVIVAISPKSFEHAIWQALNKLQEDFTCEKGSSL